MNVTTLANRNMSTPMPMSSQRGQIQHSNPVIATMIHIFNNDLSPVRQSMESPDRSRESSTESRTMRTVGNSLAQIHP